MQQSSEQPKHHSQRELNDIPTMLESGTFNQVRKTLRALTPVEIARLIESSPPPTRNVLWTLVHKNSAGAVLEELPDDIQSQFLQGLGAKDLLELTEGMEVDDIVDILQNLPEQIISEVLQAMSARDRERVELVLPYDEDTAGGLTDPDAITVRPRITLDVVMRYLRRHNALPASTESQPVA